MNILSINGSPRGEKSNTHVMIQALLEGFKSADSQIENIFLSQKRIEYCRGCYACWCNTPGYCVINDDVKEILDKLKTSDIVIFGSPLYFNNISGILKTLVDRMTPLGGDPHKDKSSNNSKQASFIMVSNCGFPDRSQFDVVSLWINKIAKMLQVDLLTEFYATSGKILSQASDKEIKHRDNYFQYLTKCGGEILKYGKLSDELKALVNQDIINF